MIIDDDMMICDDVMRGNVNDKVMLLLFHCNKIICGICALLELTYASQTHRTRHNPVSSVEFWVYFLG